MSGFIKLTFWKHAFLSPSEFIFLWLFICCVLFLELKTLILEEHVYKTSDVHTPMYLSVFC